MVDYNIIAVFANVLVDEEHDGMVSLFGLEQTPDGAARVRVRLIMPRSTFWDLLARHAAKQYQIPESRKASRRPGKAKYVNRNRKKEVKS